MVSLFLFVSISQVAVWITPSVSAPMLEPHPGSAEKFIKMPVNNQTTTSSVQIELPIKLMNKVQGHINLAGLLICDQATNCTPAGRANKDINYYSNNTWKMCKTGGFHNCRYAIRDNANLFNKLQANTRSRRSVSRHVARATEDYMTYVIGQDQTCESAADTEFCNGPLPENREFIVIVWACTSGGCSEADDSLVIKTGGK